MDTITLYKQIYPNQCENLAKLGFKSLINLRPDNECDHQPSSQSLQHSANIHHLDYQHLPICGDDLLDAHTISHFAQLINNSPKPVMVFCNTGGRAKRLYQSAKVLGFL